jgi:hypothetical protein
VIFSITLDFVVKNKNIARVMPETTFLCSQLFYNANGTIQTNL